MSPRLLLAASLACVCLLLLSTTASASATPAFVQACSTSGATVTGRSVSCQFTVPASAGDLIYVAACFYPAVTGSTASDSNGDNYLLINTNINAGGAIGCTSFYAANISASPNAKPTITVSNTSSTSWWGYVAIEYSGLDPTSPVDQVAANTGSSTTLSSGTLTTTQANDLLVAAGFIGQGIPSAGPRFRQILSTPGGVLFEDQSLGAAQTIAATGTGTVSAGWTLQAVAFKAAASGPPPTPSGPAPRSNHVAFLVLENQDYAAVAGGPSTPYLNSLMSTYAQSTGYYADTHPSIGNYFMMTTGQIITNDDNYTGTVTADNIAREMIAAGRSWHAYVEGLAYAGYTGTAGYPRHHNPFSYFSDVINSPTQALNMVPFTQFPIDLSNNALPNYSFILPDDWNNGHSCPQNMSTCTNAQILANMDNWIQTNIGPLFSNPGFQTDGILVIVFDEALTDALLGGGHVTYAIIGPGVKRGYKSTTTYQHESALRLACDALAISCPGAGATAPTQGQFFGTAPPPPPPSAPTCSLSVSPSSGFAPLGVTATGSCTDPTNDIVTTTLDWGDGTTQSGTSGSHTYTGIGSFTVRLTATDAQNLSGSAAQTVTVSSSAPACTLSVSPSSGVAPLGVSATGSCSDPGNDITTTTLNWGDGTTQSGTTGTHTYNNAGTYTVTVTATDSRSLSGTATRTVTATTVGSATPALVQQCGTNGNTVTGTSVGCTFAANVTPGDLIFVVACYYPSVTGSASDTDANRYTLIRTTTDPSGALGCTSFYAANVVASPNARPTVTVTSTTSTTCWLMMAVEYSGVSQATPVDQIADATGSSATASASLTTTQPGDLIVADAFVGQGTLGAGTGFRLLIATGGGTLLEDSLAASAQTVAVTAIGTQSSVWIIQAVAFRAR